MRSIRSLRRTISAAAGGALLTMVLVGSALGHSQIVHPPSHDDAVVSGPISKAWAQAHCNASAPAIVADRSNGVVRFLPGAALPCPAVANPGGHVHP